MSTSPVRVEPLYCGAVQRVVLARPPANLLDSEMIEAVGLTLSGLGELPGLRLLVFEGEGRHFGFGASISEHLPGQVEAMLPRFHALFTLLEELAIPTAAIVRGQCLGGACELATWCGTVFCEPTATLGFPEVTVGAFPPIAALGLRWRMTGAMATELVLTGRTVSGVQAVALGLADHCDHAPENAWRRWYEASLAPRSPAVLRLAWKAVRRPQRLALEHDLPALERVYLEELVPHPDATEGLEAFLEKRPPQWASP